jgi:hypothetical protein
VPDAVAQIQRHREEGYQWVVDADIDDISPWWSTPAF